MVVSPDYFSLFDIQVVGGRAFTTQEADDGAAVAMVSAATARTLWPGLDPIGQTLEIAPLRGRPERMPSHTSVRIIGVTEDVVSGTLTEGIDTDVRLLRHRTSVAGRDVAAGARPHGRGCVT